MFEYFKFKQLDGLSEERVQAVILEAKKDAYRTKLFWLKVILLVILAIVLGVFLMQLPKLLDISETVIGFLMQGTSILIAVVFYHLCLKVVCSKYISKQISSRQHNNQG